MRARWVAGVALAVATLLAGSGAAAGAVADGYNVTVTDAIDGPTRTVSMDDTEFTVSAVARRTPGEDVTVTVTAPPGTGYDLYLYDADREIQAAQRLTGTGQATFETDALAPGTYVVAVYRRGEFHDVFPVVVAGHGVRVSVPEGTVTDRTVRVPVTVTDRGDRGRPDAVEVVLGGRNATVRTTATVDGSGYVAIVPVVELSPGTYRVYAVAVDRRPDARDQLVGISDSRELTVGDTPPPAGTTTRRATPSPEPATVQSRSAPADVLTPSDPETTTRATGRSTVVAALALLALCFGAARRRR